MVYGQKPSEEHFRKLERMYLKIAFNKYFQPTIHIREGEADIVFPVKPEFFHAAHAVHGAVYFKALDDATFFAANSLVEDVFVLTVSFTIYFTRPVSQGEMRARGKVTYASKRLFIAEGEIVDSNGNTISRGSGTFMPSKQPLSPEIGYE